MDTLLRTDGEVSFWMSDIFRGELLVPVVENLLCKAKSGWDDYDEVYHCCRLVEQVRQGKGMEMDFHFLKRREEHVGLGLVTRGALEGSLFFPAGMALSDAMDKSLVFNYFHISAPARGNGERWLREVILPHYRDKGYQALYVKSSHPRVFSLYGRLGRDVGGYTGQSDNDLYERPGRIFRIPLL